jgi:hypothetical protein
MTPIQRAPFLREQRKFPNDEVRPLANQVDLAYIDIANKVNAREIAIYPTNFQIGTGQQWYFEGSSDKQQSLRQVFPFTSAGNIAHGLIWASVSSISPKSYGTFTDGTNWYGAIYASSVAIAGQISFYVTSVNIVVLAGAGAPSITRGYINLEWVSQV